MSQEHYLEQLPQAALEVQGGKVVALNAAAQTQLPSLHPGDDAPDYLTLPLSGQAQSGSFIHGDGVYLFSRLGQPDRQVLIFRPVDSALNPTQVEGFTRMLREQTTALTVQMDDLQAQDPRQAAQLNHALHKILRLVDHLDFLNLPLDRAKLLYQPTILDLSSQCLDLKAQLSPMLSRAGVELEVVSHCPDLLIPGDPQLLQRMLLCLLSNAAKAAQRVPNGKVILELTASPDRVMLTLSDNSGSADLSRLAPQDPEAIPAPDQGAGMGLAVARRVAQLHGGTLLAQSDPDQGLTCTVSLPIGPLPTALPVATPKVDCDSGLNPLLVELADLLPADLYDLEPE